MMLELALDGPHRLLDAAEHPLAHRFQGFVVGLDGPAHGLHLGLGRQHHLGQSPRRLLESRPVLGRELPGLGHALGLLGDPLDVVLEPLDVTLDELLDLLLDLGRVPLGGALDLRLQPLQLGLEPPHDGLGLAGDLLGQPLDLLDALVVGDVVG
ncbi:MAG: hypothetical protein ACRD2T_14195, partial [Thermoanaerobaculia bacterium]